MTMKSSVDSIEDGIIRLETPEGASVRISLQGAQILSWVPAQGGERLYLSERARFQPDQPIRGGIPVIFPQFAHQGSGQRHGFAKPDSRLGLGPQQAGAGREDGCGPVLGGH